MIIQCVQDCNVMLAVFDPFKQGLKTYRGYDIESLGDTFRTIQVLKNRYGIADVEVGMNFFGQINYFHELPSPDKISDYSIYTSPHYILNKNKEFIV